MRGMIVEDFVPLNNCKHWLGVMLSDYESLDIVVLQDSINDSNFYVDYLFDYCPKCGSKIIWKTKGEQKFTEKLKGEQNGSE